MNSDMIVVYNYAFTCRYQEMDLIVGLIEILETNQAPEKNDIQCVINVIVELQYANEIE